MESLPVEIFEAIFTQITELPDLKSLRAVNKFFRVRFTPPAFESVHFQRITQGSTKFRGIVSSGLSQNVVNLSFDILLSSLSKRVFERCRRVFGALGAFASVKSISLHFEGATVTSTSPRRHRRLELQLLILTSISSNRSISITSLTITNFRGSLHEYYLGPEFRRFLGGLTHCSLHFNKDSVGSMGTPGGSPFFKSFAETWLKPMEERLESLELGTVPLELIPSFPIQNANLSFSKLKKLTCRNCLFVSRSPGEVSLESFIISPPVASTLEELLLSGCVIHHELWLDKGWSDVISKFKENLKNLKRFEIVSPAYQWSLFTTADSKALVALWDSIGQVERVLPEFFDPDLWNSFDTFDIDSFLNMEDTGSGSGFDGLYPGQE